MDEATHEMFSAIGHPSDTLFKENVALPLIETHCNFKRPVQYNTELIVQSEIMFIKEKVFKLSHQFYCEGQLVAEGYEIRAWASIVEAPAKAVTIPEQVKNKLLLKE